jgi:hypothetical protein
MYIMEHDFPPCLEGPSQICKVFISLITPSLSIAKTSEAMHTVALLFINDLGFTLFCTTNDNHFM